MKGIELLSSLIGILMLMGLGALMGGAIIFILNASIQPTTSKIDYEMFLSPIYPPIKYESMLLSYLETTEEVSGLQFKKILTYAAYQEDIDVVFVDGDKMVTTLSASSYDVFSLWLDRDGYMLVLNVDGKGYLIAENSRSLPKLPDQKFSVKRISVPLYIDSNSLKGVNYDKTRELPLRVTLDFYVQ